jgi:hypothetical protein
MKRNGAQNRLAIEIACECLNSNASIFANVARNRDQGTFPRVYATAVDRRTGVEYLIGITSRVETGADGTLNPAYNIVHSAADRTSARALAKGMNRTLAFVAITLRETDGSYASYFGQLEPLGFPIEIRMLPRDRLAYLQLAPYTRDARVKQLLAS